MIDAKKKAFAIATLRRASYRWYGRYTALKNANIGRNQYVCAMCPPGTVHPKKNIQLDHVSPIVPLTGWDNFDGFIDRLLCDTEGYQVLCKEHHQAKTIVENSERKENRKASNKKKVKKIKEKA
jgi:hypothetical protein